MGQRREDGDVGGGPRPIFDVIREEVERASTFEECMQRSDELVMDMAQIRTQLEAAKAIAKETGHFANRDWFRRASMALRLKGVRHQAYLRRASHLRGRDKEARGRTFEKSFIDAARRRLNPEVFAGLLQEAREESGE